MANATGFTVITERLDEAATYIKEKTMQYNTDIQKLYSEADGLTSSAWTGVASDTFRQKLESYRSDFDALKTSLTQFADALSTKSGNYTKTENSVTSNASAL